MTGTHLARETLSGWVIQAPAKLNVLLDVLPKRLDGYHGIRTLLCPMRIGDTLRLKLLKGNEGRIRLRVVDRLPRAVSSPVPLGETNLVTRALRAIFARCNAQPNCEVTLTKRVPSQAGLGGGSSDAAAALLAANRAWGFQLSTDQLIETAAQVGSDVPALLFRRATWCEGRGEVVSPAAVPAGIPVLIAKPHQGLSTADVFRDCVPAEPSDNGRLMSLLTLLRQGRLQQASRLMTNQLQAPAEKLCGELSRLLALLRECGAVACQMTGSGSACFALCHNHTHAARAASWLKSRGVAWTVATSTS